MNKVDLFNLLVIPPYLPTGDVDRDVIDAAVTYCEERRAIAIIDPPSTWTTPEEAAAGVSAVTASKNAALYFPRLRQPNPLRGDAIETFAPSGAVAGVIARTDATRGVWAAAAGLAAGLVGVPQLALSLKDSDIGELNPLSINCLRTFAMSGPVVWGSRTRAGDDRLASEWKYLPVRRTALFIEESLFRGTRWAVFEPNNETLWAQLRLSVGTFLHDLFRQGAFAGSTPHEAYFGKCDETTTTHNDINNGVLNIVVGFAPLKPAEFVIVRVQQHKQPPS